MTYWKKHGYPKIEADLSAAFSEISRNVEANDRRVCGRFSKSLGNFKLHKYRQADSNHKRGASGGWRILAIYDVEKANLYPILIWPKKVQEDAGDSDVMDAIQSLLTYLSQQPF